MPFEAAGQFGGVDVRQHTDARDLERDVLVIAAGAHSSEFGVELPIRPLARQLLETEPIRDLPPDLPMVIEAETGFHFRRRDDCLRIAMPDAEPRWGFEETVDEAVFADRLERLAHRYPPAAEAGIAHAWAGLYDMTPDAHPIIGPVADGLYAACGFSGHGFMQSPAVGRAVAAELLRGDFDELSTTRGPLPPPISDSIKSVRQSSDSAPLRDWRFYWDLLSEDRRARILSVIAARLASVTVVLDRLLDPHNTAAILRTSEGLGLGRAHVVSHESQDALAHRRVTQDADKWLDVELHPTGGAAAAELKARGFEVWAGHLDDSARLYTDLPADRPIALLFGNEHEGPEPETIAACAGTFPKIVL